jgi:hypothetical protein
MAISFNTLNNGLLRSSGGFLSTGSDFTVMFWMQYPTSIGNTTDYRTVWVLGDDTFTAGYVWVGITAGLSTVALCNNFNLQTQNDIPVTSFTSPAQAIPTIWSHVAVTYDHTTHVATLYINGSLFEAATAIDLSAVTFAAERFAFDAEGAVSGIGITYYRSFQTKLTADQIKAEMASTIAVASSPFCDTPLTSPSDLADISGNGRDWTLVGSGNTINGPNFITSITNIDPSSALDVGTPPFTIVQNVSDSTTHDVWFKYTAQPSDKVIGLYGFGDLSVYVVRSNPYNSLANANADIPIPFIAVNSEPQQISVFNGVTYYFKMESLHGTSSSPAVLVFSGLLPVLSIAPKGSIAIPDDLDGGFGLPLVILDHLTGIPIQFINNFAVASNADILPASGRLLLSGSMDASDGNEYLFMFDINNQLLYSKIAVPPLVNNSAPYLVSSDQNSTFYVAKLATSTTAKVTTINALTGLQGPKVWTITISGSLISGIAPSLDNTILYYTVGTTGDSAIRRWDLVNDIALTNLVSAPATYKTSPIIAGGQCDILVLQNNDIVISYNKAKNDCLIYVYDNTGATVSTVTVNQLVDRLTHALDDPNSYWAWIQQTKIVSMIVTQNGFSEYRNIKTSDGSTISTTGTELPNYEFGTYDPGVVIAPIARFGASASCPFWITRSIMATGGIYQIVPSKRDDTLITTGIVKIPDPSFKTGLIGG